MGSLLSHNMCPCVPLGRQAAPAPPGPSDNDPILTPDSLPDLMGAPGVSIGDVLVGANNSQWTAAAPKAPPSIGDLLAASNPTSALRLSVSVTKRGPQPIKHINGGPNFWVPRS